MYELASYDDADDRRTTEWWLTVDQHGNEVLYRPRDPARPDDCCYVTLRDFFHTGRPVEITFHLGTEPPPGNGWRLMREPRRTMNPGYLGWWRAATGATTPSWRPSLGQQ